MALPFLIQQWEMRPAICNTQPQEPMFGCPRSRNAHIERKKSKCDYLLSEAPTEEQIAQIANTVNEIIASNLPVTIGFVSKEEAASFLDLGKLPDDASETIRVVRVGDYDACACIGTHGGACYSQHA